MTDDPRTASPDSEEPRPDRRRFQVQWSRDIEATSAEAAAQVAAGQENLRIFTMDLESGARETVMLDRSAVSGAAALREAAAQMEHRLKLTADDPMVTKASVLSFLRRRATELEDGVQPGWATVDLDALGTVLLDSVGRHVRDEIFGAWSRAMGDSASRASLAVPPVTPRIDVVVNRDSDAGTDVHVYVDGVLAETVVHTIDPGRSGADHEWWNSVTTLGPEVPQAVRDRVEEYADSYHAPERCGRPCV